MTREDILQMPAGRDLDALVAEKVIGWPHATLAEYCNWLGYGEDAQRRFAEYKPRFIRIDEQVIEEVPFYSTEIAAAWQVVEQLKDYHFDLRRHRYTYDEGQTWVDGWWVQFSRHVGLAEIASLAICRAALLTMDSAEP